MYVDLAIKRNLRVKSYKGDNTMNCHNWKIQHTLQSFILIGVFLFARPGFGAPVSMDLAEQVADNFLNHVSAVHTIESIKAVESNEEEVGYLVQLSPQGYILVAGDNIRVPIKGYSLTSTFSDLPETYTQNLLRELEVSTTNSHGILSTQPDNTNAPHWEYLLRPPKLAISTLIIQSYEPDTFLLTSQWNQSYPYNSLIPTIDGEPTLTGCVQIAVAQIMLYHAHPTVGSGVFTHTWNDQILTAVMNRPFNWDIMPDIVNGSVPQYQRDEVAALIRDISILNRANFGLDFTSTMFRYWDFERAFGYASIYEMDISDPDLFFTTIKNEIDNLRPLLLSMPGHMTVADGYASDGTGRKIHINLGWGGNYDDYYYLDQTNIIGPYSFSPDHRIFYNIRPCEGDECYPYVPTGGGQPPVITSSLPDIIIDGTGTTLRIDAYDPDGDTVTLSSSSTCDVQAELNSNLLTLTPLDTDIYCQVDVQAQSDDGTTFKTFNVLCLEDMIYLGTQYDIGGQFADQDEIDLYSAYLEGYTTISGHRGYSNQAFYIWIKDQYGNTVAGPSNEPISVNLEPGFYTIAASLRSDMIFYPYSDDRSSYLLRITGDELTYTVSDLATSLGISLESEEGIGLNIGWNLISLSEHPTDTSISTVLNTITDKYISVWAYIDGSWKVYDPANPGFSDLTTMETGMGYWINMSSTATLTVSGSVPSNYINLSTGWNLVGYNSDTAQAVADALASIEGKYISVWAYINGSWQVYDPNNPGFSDLTTIEPGYGYWINASEACTWTLP